MASPPWPFWPGWQVPSWLQVLLGLPASPHLSLCYGRKWPLCQPALDTSPSTPGNADLQCPLISTLSSLGIWLKASEQLSQELPVTGLYVALKIDFLNINESLLSGRQFGNIHQKPLHKLKLEYLPPTNSTSRI